jgi:hypothetical protein
MIGADVTLSQILDIILIEGLFPSLGKQEGLLVIKNKPCIKPRQKKISDVSH